MDSRDLPVTAALAALSVTVALAFGLVLRGDRWILPLVAVAVLPHVAGTIGRATRLGAPYVAIATSFVALTVGVVLVGGPEPGRVLDGLGDGVDALFTGASQLAPTDGVVTIGMCIVWAVATIADHVALDRGGSIGAVVPGVVVMVLFAGKQPADLWIPICVYGVAAAVFLALQHRRLLDRQRTWIGDRPTTGAAWSVFVVGLTVGALAVAASVGGAVALVDSDRPLVDFGEILPEGESPSSYRTQVAPIVNVGNELRQPEITTLFRVRADAAAYWRTVALDEYSSEAGGQWTIDAADDEVADELEDAVPDGALVQEFEITSAMVERWIPAAYRAVDVEGANLGLVVPASATLVTDDETIAGARYTVSSALPPDASQINRGAATAAVPDDVVEYTELPDDIPPIIVETAQAVAGDLPDPVTKAAALAAYFRDGSFVYDPDIAIGDDVSAIDTFMRTREGFCVQFATAYALMARSLGIPARIGIGYVPGTLDEASGTYVVTNQDAHAWPELFFTGTGWATPYDPTPPGDGTLPGGSDLPGELEQETTPATTPPTAAPPPTVPPTSPTPTAGPSASTPADAPPDGGDGASVQIDTQERSSQSEPLFPAFVLVALVVLLLVIPLVVPVALKRRRHRRRRRDPDPAEAITGAWREALDTLTDHRVPPSSTATPMETAVRVSAATDDAAWPAMWSLATSYSEVRYADGEPTSRRAEAAWRDVDALRDVLDDSLGPLARVRTRLSLRSLRRDRGERGERTRPKISEPV